MNNNMLIVIVVVAIIAIAGFFYYKSEHDKSAPNKEKVKSFIRETVSLPEDCVDCLAGIVLSTMDNNAFEAFTKKGLKYQTTFYKLNMKYCSPQCDGFL